MPRGFLFQFLSPYKIPLSLEPDYVSPWSTPESKFTITAVNDVVDRIAGTRSLKLQIDHPGLIWTGKATFSSTTSVHVPELTTSAAVIAFDAHVLKWNLDDNPPDEYTRHHVKEASFYGSNTWSIDLVVKIDPKSTLPDDGALLVNFIGLQEQGMWPGKAGLMTRGEPGIALTLFDRLDRWIDEQTGGKMDTLLLGCMAGIERI